MSAEKKEDITFSDIEHGPSKEFESFDNSQSIRKMSSEPKEFGIEGFDNDNYNSQFDTLVSVRKIDSISGDKTDSVEQQSGESVIQPSMTVTSSADKYRVPDSDDDFGKHGL